jgi:heterodisulfide reductase subunit B2
MRSYAYFPGCSLKATAKPYETSLLDVAKALDVELRELDDWNCCGATAYFSVRETLSHAISARNLAIAEKQGLDVVAPCSACYLGLSKTNHYLQDFPDLKKRVDDALAAGGLTYNGSVRVRHALEVFVQDVGIDAIEDQVKKPLDDLKVAGYAGCQMVRPYGFDDPEVPEVLDRLTRALGGTPVDFPLASRCCGGAQVMTNQPIALAMCRELLACADGRQADVIVTTCPLCHMNLDLFQGKVNAAFGTSFHIPVVFFTQLMALAFGLGRTGIDKNIVPVGPKLAGLVAG